MPEPIDLPITGRGHLTARATFHDGYAIVRIEDDSHKAFWADLTLSAMDVRDLLNAIRKSTLEEAVS